MQNGIPVGLRSSPSFGLSRSGQLTAIIQSLFWDGSQGWWYDDNDTTTLFQDSAGTTPVTAVEQSVGLQLDKSRGLVLGSALITPEAGPYVSAPTGVSAAGSGVLSVVSGAVRETAPGGTASRLEIAFAATAAKTYRVSILVNSNFGFVPVAFVNTVDANPFGASPFYASGSTTLTFYVSAVATSNIILRFYPRSSTVPNQISGDYVEFSSISVRELPGNHRYAPASGNRPIWSKRVNLLTKTEQFNDNAVWESTITGTGIAATVTADQGTAPDGTNTADRIQFNLGGGTTTSDITRRRQLCVTPATAHTFSLYLRSFDGVSSYNMHIVGADGATTNIVVTGAWQRFTVTANGPGGAVGYAVGLRGGQTPANSNTADILAWGADLRPANQATGLLPLYQRVNTSTDYETNGFPGYLKADGVDDFLQTNTINFGDGPTNPPLGPELVTNGTFDTNINGWTAQFTSTASWQSGALRSISSGTNAGEASSPITCVIGRTYRVTGTVLGGTSTGRITASSSAFGGSGGSYVASGNQTFCFVATATTMYIVCGNGGAANGVFCDYDNISVKEITNANLGADKITLCAGVRKLSDAAQAVVTELSASIANPGSFAFYAPSAAGTDLSFFSGGTTFRGATQSGFASPITAVASGIGNISGDSAILRVNGAQVASNTGDQGTGNYGNYVTYFFRRGGSSLPFNGYEYGNIAVGKLLTADQTVALETYMNGLTKAY